MGCIIYTAYGRALIAGKKAGNSMARPTKKMDVVRNPDAGDGQALLQYVIRNKKKRYLEHFLLGLLVACIGVSVFLVFF